MDSTNVYRRLAAIAFVGSTFIFDLDLDVLEFLS
jgi:hypothetical protein